MTVLKAGGLFYGYGGIEMGLRSVVPSVNLCWYAEFDKKASLVGAHHHPGVPNYGDVTKIDWHNVEPVDILTGGSPCQDLSHAGKRAGMADGTRSGLWASMCDAIDIIRPRLVVWENVRGALSARSHKSETVVRVGPRGGRKVEVTHRALGRVLADLAELGYDARWYGLRAADVGAPHGRFRVFLFATPANSGGLGGLEAFQHHGRGAAAVDGSGVPDEPDRDALRPGPDGVEHVPGQLTLLPTPAVNDMGAAYTPEERDAWTERMKAAHGNGNGHGKSLSVEALRLLPTPSVADGLGGHLSRSGERSDELLLPGVAKQLATPLLPTPQAHDAQKGKTAEQVAAMRARGHGVANLNETVENGQDWREYEPAIRRWEALTRPAPTPTEPGAKGQPRLSPRFVEWLMGLPAGHVTDVPGLTRNDMLKALGNGVVPQQCADALRAFLSDSGWRL